MQTCIESLHFSRHSCKISNATSGFGLEALCFDRRRYSLRLLALLMIIKDMRRYWPILMTKTISFELHNLKPTASYFCYITKKYATALFYYSILTILYQLYSIQLQWMSFITSKLTLNGVEFCTTANESR